MSSDGLKKGFLFIISAPSGTGKTTLCRYLLGRYSNLSLSISTTTRKPRKKEIDGIDYFFTSKHKFEEKIANNEFLEHAKVFDNYYGTSLDFVQSKILEGKNVLFDIDWQGMRNIKKEGRFNVSTVFLIPPSIDILRQRLQGRGDSEEQVEKRIAGFQNDAEKADEYDYVIINDDLNKACFDVENVYNAEMQKYSKQDNIEYIKNVLLDNNGLFNGSI